MSEYINDIKILLFDFFKDEYKKYLHENKILCIKSSNIYKIANKFYDDNISKIKTIIRSKLKEKYKDDYSSATVENMILEIFQNSEDNIVNAVNEIDFIQNKNYMELELPIINNSLNLNISNSNGYIIINHLKDTLDPNLKDKYNDILNYKFIYSINNKILDDYDTDNKINIIKDEIMNKTIIKLGVYYLKNNIE
tara:strand:+ start:2058 stop:2642 length:585 start_codon:yes stop_codon:yes gene_type:complete